MVPSRSTRASRPTGRTMTDPRTGDRRQEDRRKEDRRKEDRLYGGPPYGGPPLPDRALPARRRTRKLAIAVLVLGGLGFVGFGIGALVQAMPRKFTAEQRQQITDWEFGKRWRDLTGRRDLSRVGQLPGARRARR